MGLLENDSVLQLVGDRRKTPVKNGDVILMHGYFDDGSRTGPAVAVVIKPGESERDFVVKPLGAEDGYWHSFLMDGMTKVVKFQEKAGEELGSEGRPQTANIIEKFAILSSGGDVPDLSPFRWLGKNGASEAVKTVLFLRELMVSDLPVAARKDLGNSCPVHTAHPAHPAHPALFVFHKEN